MLPDESFDACVILFSGGTDSTCVAAICAEKHREIHLLTFEEAATKKSPLPMENVSRLKERFENVRFNHFMISTDRLVRRLAYLNYFKNLKKHGFFLLSTPGFSSLSWHLRTIVYCKKMGIDQVYDGMTQELLHFPGHMPKVRELIRQMYADHGIKFGSPVINWDVPPDQRFTDRLIVDRHGFSIYANAQPNRRTTGFYLYEKAILPHPNVKGSLFDRKMQHDCYPFVVFNIFVFWLFLSWKSFESYEIRMTALMADKILEAKNWLDTSLADEAFSELEHEKRLV